MRYMKNQLKTYFYTPSNLIYGRRTSTNFNSDGGYKPVTHCSRMHNYISRLFTASGGFLSCKMLLYITELTLTNINVKHICSKVTVTSPSQLTPNRIL